MEQKHKVLDKFMNYKLEFLIFLDNLQRCKGFSKFFLKKFINILAYMY